MPGDRRSGPPGGTGTGAHAARPSIGGVRTAAGHSASRSAADTTPRNAAREPLWVLSRSCRRTLPMPGVSQSLVIAEIASGASRAPHTLIAVTPPSGSRCFPTTGSEAPATLKASA